MRHTIAFGRLLVILISLFIFCPNLAGAQNLDFTEKNVATYFTPAPNDQSLQLIGQVLGSFGVNHFAERSPSRGHSNLYEMFGAFNYIILIFGVIVVAYTTLVATMNTAHQGKMMGDRWSSMWVPVRTVLGLGLLLPSEKGYALIQSLVMWIVMNGVGAADNVWNEMSQHLVLKETRPIPVRGVLKVNGGEVINNVIFPLLRGGLCTLDKKVSWYDSAGETRDLKTSYRINFGNNRDSPECGFVEVQSQKKGQGDSQGNAVEDKVFEAQKKALKKMMPRIIKAAEIAKKVDPGLTYKEVMNLIKARPLDFDPSANPNDKAKQNEARTVDSSVRPLGKPIQVDVSSAVDFATNITGALVIYIGDLKKEQEAQIKAEVEQKSVEDKPPLEKIQEEGWLYAGSLYNLLSREISTRDESVKLRTNLIKAIKYDKYQLAQQGLDNVTKAFKEYYEQTKETFEDTDAHTLVVAMRMLSETAACLTYKDKEACSYLQKEEENRKKAEQEALSKETIGRRYMTMAREHFIRNDYTRGEINLLMKVKDLWNDRIRKFFELTQKHLVDNTGDPLTELIIYGQQTAKELGGTIKHVIDYTVGVGVPSIISGSIASASSGIGASMSGGIGAKLSGIPFAGIAAAMHTVNTILKFPSIIIQAQGPMMISISAMFFTQAAMLGIYVPLIPFVMFSFGALGWMIMVIESTVAAPIIALGATIPEGNEVFGKAIPALMMISNIFLRPMLMLFGLYAGVLLATVGIEYFTAGFNILFFNTFNVNNTSLSDQNIFYWMAIVFIYSGLLVFLLQKCFSMVSALPERVLRWIGDTSQGVSGGEEALGELRSAAQKGGEAGGQMGSEAGRSTGQATEQAGSAMTSGSEHVAKDASTELGTQYDSSGEAVPSQYQIAKTSGQKARDHNAAKVEAKKGEGEPKTEGGG